MNPVGSREILLSAARLALELNANWYAVYVTASHGSEEDSQIGSLLGDDIAFAQNLGAVVVRVSADDAAAGFIAFAEREGITHVVFGERPQRTRRWTASTGKRLREIRGATVTAVPLASESQNREIAMNTLIEAGQPQRDDATESNTALLRLSIDAEQMKVFCQLVFRRLALLATIWLIVAGALLSTSALWVGLTVLATLAAWAAIASWCADRRLATRLATHEKIRPAANHETTSRVAVD